MLYDINERFNNLVNKIQKSTRAFRRKHKFSKLLKRIERANSNPVETNKRNWKAYQENNKAEKMRRYLKKKAVRLKKGKIPKWYKYQCRKWGVEYAS